jgi:hypothetical protein
LIFRNFEDLLSLNKELHLAGTAASSVSQAVLLAEIRQLEGDMVVLIENQPIRITCLSDYLLGATL